MGKKMQFHHLIILVIIMNSSNLYAAECIYVPKQTPDNPYPELSSHGKCGQLTDQDTFQLSDEHFNNLYFSEDGLASILYDGAMFYVSKSGKTVRTYYIDNGADYFVEGVARTILNNKFGYIDEQLNVVINPEYDFAFPFENGMAVVCNGCRSEPDGEHKIVVGGKWGVINKFGKVVVPLKYGKKELWGSLEYKHITSGPTWTK